MNKYKIILSYLLLVIAFGLTTVLRPQSVSGQQSLISDPNANSETEPPVTVERVVDGQDSWAKYQVILQRNIFSRQRGPVRQRRERSRPVVIRNPESYHVLKGIVQEDGTFIAFIENTQSNTVLKLREGDSVARGTVKNFSLDTIEYQFEDKTIAVALGRDLEGGQGTLSMNRLLELSAATSPASDPNTPAQETIPSDEEAEILRKLMEQRKQQLGQ